MLSRLRLVSLILPALMTLSGCELLGVLPVVQSDAGTVAPRDAGEVTDAGEVDGGLPPETDGGEPRFDDGGLPPPDAGMPPPDGGMPPPPPDGGMPPPPPDGGMPPPPPDGGMPPPPPDGGMPPPPPDGGMPPPPPDGGMPPPPPDGGMPPPPPDGGMPPPLDGGLTGSACDQAWGQVTRLYANATNLTSCDGIAGASYVVNSLMNMDGVTIDNNGVTMTPCIQTRCDSTYVYVATNALPHYDFVQTTPNPLQEVAYIYRLPMTTHVVGANAGAVNATDITGCMAAYQAVVSGSGATSSEPSGFCGNDGYYYDILADDVYDYHRKVPCLNTDGMMISGPPIFGPNEGQTPDPWGDPAYNWPNVAGETVIGGAQLDLCGGHTANSMHYHAVNEACFTRDGDGHGVNSYVTATQNWDFGALFTTDCTEESPIVGWSLDGYPIRGPCVCLTRNEDGSCAQLKRARSSWVYGGLSAWGTAATALSAEAMTCGSTSDCCQGTGSCKYKCSWSVFPDENAAGGTVADKRCVLVDYAWCTSQFVDRSGYDPAEANFVYMDRCNGYEGPDGYSYYATGSFPFLIGCYHGVPSDAVGGATLGGMMPPMGDGGMMPPPDGGMPPPPDGGMPPPPDGGMMPRPDGGMPPPPDGGGMMPPMCASGQTTMCCGDNFCGGPENHQNCPADCH